MQHVMVIHDDLGGQGQTASLADDYVLADFPVSAGLTFTN
jgi:hypothetical protein